MEKEKALGILITHNRWRRGEDVEPMLKPSDIGKAIDVAIKELEQTPDLMEENMKRKTYPLWELHSFAQSMDCKTFIDHVKGANHYKKLIENGDK